MQFEDLQRDMPLDTGAKRIKVAKMLLKGETRDRFNNILRTIDHDDDIDDPVTDEIKFEEAIARLKTRFFQL